MMEATPTRGGDVPTHIYLGEHVQEMEGGEADVEVACLTGWSGRPPGTTHHGSVLWPRRAGKRGWRLDLLVEHAQGNYESEAALVEPQVRSERVRRKGAMTTGSSGLGWPCTRSRAAAREEESSAVRENGLAPHLDPVGQFVLTRLNVRSTRIGV
jgi:hypothetical protein